MPCQPYPPGKMKKIIKMKKKTIITGIITGIIIMMLNQTGARNFTATEHAAVNRIENSPIYRDGKFNPFGDIMEMSMGDYLSTTLQFLFSRNNRTPANPLPVVPVDPSLFNRSETDGLNVTWLGHSSLMINIDGYRVLTDPVFEKRVSIVGPTRFNGEVPFSIDRLKEVDAVVISHDHYDHLNRRSVLELAAKAKKFIVPLGVGERLTDWGISEDKVVELDWWESFSPDGGLEITATPARHFSGRGLMDRDKTLWASWVIAAPSHRVFFSGDSGYFDGFKRIGEKYGPFDMTFIECGAYDKAWRGVHMFPEQTVRAHLDLRGKILHPIHWATFNLALHPWHEPMERLSAAAETAGVNVATPIVGETSDYDSIIPNSRWWETVVAAKIAGGGNPR